MWREQLSGTVAIVDDDALVRESVAGVLRSAGFRVCTFGSAYQILDSMALLEAQCLLTDLEMPEMNGCELQLHVGGRRPNLPIIFLTGSTDENVKHQALRRGAFAYLSKPTGCAELINVVAQAVACLPCN